MPKINILDTEDRWDRSIEDEFLWWPRVQWIDPGGTSGLSQVWFDPKALFEGKTTAKVVLAHSQMYLNGPETGANGQVNRYMRMARSLSYEHDSDEPEYRPGLALGCESFRLRIVNADWEFLAPVRIRAALEDRLADWPNPLAGEDALGVPLHLQTPSDAKNAFTDDRLRQLRMYTPGPDHIRDSTRHCLLWIRKLRTAGLEFFKEAHGYEEGWFA